MITQKQGFIENIEEKPTQKFLVSAGIYVLENEILNLIAKNEYLDMPELIKLALQKGKVNTYIINDYWIDIGRLDEFLKPMRILLCNRFIKLGKLLEFAKSLGCEKLATGHYARLENNLIRTAVDESKDQSYFLASADKEALKYLIFPLGEMKKEDVKKFASTIEVLKSFATQKESSEICFVEDTYVQVLDQFMDTKIPGEVLDSSGKVVGKHEGYMHYTIGKRRGFEVRGAHKPHFVLKINPKQNQIIVGTKEELKINEFKLKNINLFIDAKELDCEVKIRYRSKSTPCKVIISDDKSASISLKESVYGLASGQMAVFYDGDKVIASGFIE